MCYSSARQDEIKRRIREQLSELFALERFYDCKICKFSDAFLIEHIDSVSLCDIGMDLEVCWCFFYFVNLQLTTTYKLIQYPVLPRFSDINASSCIDCGKNHECFLFFPNLWTGRRLDSGSLSSIKHIKTILEGQYQEYICFIFCLFIWVYMVAVTKFKVK